MGLSGWGRKWGSIGFGTAEKSTAAFLEHRLRRVGGHHSTPLGALRARRFDSVGNFQKPTESKRKSAMGGVSVDTWGSDRPLPE